MIQMDEWASGQTSLKFTQLSKPIIFANIFKFAAIQFLEPRDQAAWIVISDAHA